MQYPPSDLRLQAIIFTPEEFELAKAFTLSCMDSKWRFYLASVCCPAAGLGDRYPAIRSIEMRDFTSNDWAVRAYREHLALKVDIKKRKRGVRV